MHVPDLKHEFRISPHILSQVIICGIHKVVEFAPWDVIGIPWNKFSFNPFLKEFPSVTMVIPFLLFHCFPPCGSIAFQVRLGKFHGQMSSNLGGMQIILHFGKPNIHNLSVMGTIEVPGFGRLKSRILDALLLRVATNSLKSGLFILRRTSNCSWVNRTELPCSSSFLGSS